MKEVANDVEKKERGPLNSTVNVEELQQMYQAHIRTSLGTPIQDYGRFKLKTGLNQMDEVSLESREQEHGFVLGVVCGCQS